MLAGQARNAPLTRPRPGHADLVGMQKYDFDEARPVLERASARETAARVALGRVASNFLQQALGVTVLSHVVELGTVAAPAGVVPAFADLAAIDDDPVRCFDRDASAAMIAEVETAQKDGDTLGGVVEVVVWGLPPGLGSHVHWDRRLDARLAGALMGIQAIKGVEVGDGFTLARTRGSAAHDEIVPGADGHRPRLAPLRRHRGRHEHRRGAAGPGGDEADRHRAAGAAYASTSPPARPRWPTTSAPTSARCRPPAWSPRRWWRWCWPTPRWRSSAATRWARPGATTRATSPHIADRGLQVRAQ